jgi:2-C-methyl-D-erythritol 4-phosphate cytidylyltransferase
MRSDVVVWTVVVAAGSGARFGGQKQFATLGDRRVLDWSLEAAAAVSDGIVIVGPSDDESQKMLASCQHKVVVGGATRSASVRNGLAAVPDDADIVLVHDGARPFADVALYRNVLEAFQPGIDGVIPAVAVVETVKQVDEDGTIVMTIDRSLLRLAQTPQAFRASVLQTGGRRYRRSVNRGSTRRSGDRR